MVPQVHQGFVTPDGQIWIQADLHCGNSPRTHESVKDNHDIPSCTPRGNRLVERHNRTLLTLLRVYTSHEHIDGVLGAYNSTRHATTGFSPYMIQHGAEKSIPLFFIYPEFAARGFESKEEFVEHLLTRQQEIHESFPRGNARGTNEGETEY